MLRSIFESATGTDESGEAETVHPFEISAFGQDKIFFDGEEDPDGLPVSSFLLKQIHKVSVIVAAFSLLEDQVYHLVQQEDVIARVQSRVLPPDAY